MGRYQVKAPDGHTYEIEAPDDATPQQLDAMTREVAGYSKDYPVKAVAPPKPEPVSDAVLPTTPSLDNAADQFGQNLENDVAGIVQGAASLPDMAATAAGKAMSVVPTVVGYGLDSLRLWQSWKLHARRCSRPRQSIPNR
jgi:hypothetical protein